MTVDLTANQILLDNEAELADKSSDIANILTHVQSLLPEFMTAKLQGSDPYQINIVCACVNGSNMAILNVNELTRANIDDKVAETVKKTFNYCPNTHPKGYSL
jgi:hypothetical protein